MSTEDIFCLFDTCKEVAFATVEGDRPRIRVFQVMRREGRRLFFATSPKKEVYKQLQMNPNAEVMVTRNNVFLRITGQVVFVVEDTTKREIYSANPVLPRLYAHYDDLVYFRLEAASTEYYDLTPTPPTIISEQL